MMTPETRSTLAETFRRDGFVATGRLLSPAEVETYRQIYDRFLSGEIDAGPRRSDLGSGSETSRAGVENITQIMWPSALHTEVLRQPLHERCLVLARDLIGADAAFDFDMLIDKAPGTATPTPWHQDAAYWPDLPDTRAVSFWVSLDHAGLNNGCMWYVRGSHRAPLRPHRPAGSGGGALECDCTEAEPGATPAPLMPGEAAAHAGGTLHYSRGNTTTDQHRRAYILNYRPAAMIQLERQQGMDHGLERSERKVRNRAAH